MAFLHLDLSLARLRFRCFLRRSVLTTSFHLNFGLPQDVGQSAWKLMIFFVDDLSCRYKWSDSFSLFDLRTSSIWWTRILLHRSSVECFCSILIFLTNESLHGYIFRDKCSVDRGQGSVLYRRTLLIQSLNTFPRFTRDISLFASIGRSWWKAFQADPIRSDTASVPSSACPLTSPR